MDKLLVRPIFPDPGTRSIQSAGLCRRRRRAGGHVAQRMAPGPDVRSGHNGSRKPAVDCVGSGLITNIFAPRSFAPLPVGAITASLPCGSATAFTRWRGNRARGCPRLGARVTRWRRPIIYGLIGVSLAAPLRLEPRDKLPSTRPLRGRNKRKPSSTSSNPAQSFVGYGDAYVFPITYLHVVEGERADLRLLETRGLLFDDHVVHLSWSQRRKDAAWNTFFADLKRPGYFQNLGPNAGRLRANRDLGLPQADRSGRGPGQDGRGDQRARQRIRQTIAHDARREKIIGSNAIATA